MFLGGMFRGAANQTTGAQQRAAEDYVSVINCICFFYLDSHMIYLGNKSLILCIYAFNWESNFN